MKNTDWTVKIYDNTPHLFMWFTDGKKLGDDGQLIVPENALPLPSQPPLDYLTRLKEECAKLKATKTPVYLTYSGRMLTSGQKKAMENLANQPGFENLMVINYDDVEKKIKDVSGFYADSFESRDGRVFTSKKFAKVSAKQIKDSVERSIKVWTKGGEVMVPHKGGEHDVVMNNRSFAIQSAIDSIRLVLLYNSDAVKEVAKSKYRKNAEKIKFISRSWAGILYRDFDVTLKSEKAPNLNTNQGCITSLNCEVIFAQWQEKIIKKYPQHKDSIDSFCQEHLFDIDNYLKTVKDFHAISKGENLDEVDRLRLVGIEESLRKLTNDQSEFTGDLKSSLFFKLFINPIAIENSLIAFNCDRHKIAANLLVEVFRTKDAETNNLFAKDPYIAVKRWTRLGGDDFRISLPSNDDVIGNAGFENIIHNLEALRSYKIDSDLSWDKNQNIAHESQKLVPPSDVKKPTGRGFVLQILKRLNPVGRS